MVKIGTLETIWRYPVKSMRGEQVDAIFASHVGLMGDRLYAVADSAADPVFPWHTNREQEELVLHVARYKKREETLIPVTANAALAEGLNPPYPAIENFSVEVELPNGAKVDINDPALLEGMKDMSDGELSIYHTQKNLVDCKPLSLMSMQTLAQLNDELGMTLDVQRFRQSFYVNWDSEGGYYENDLVGRSLKIGDSLEIKMLELDPRCKSVTVDPETAETTPKILRHLNRKHGGVAGVFAAVLQEGIVKPGDEISLLD